MARNTAGWRLVENGLIRDVGELRGKDLVCWCAPQRLPRRRVAQAGEPMPRDGSLILSDVRTPTLTIACERCGRHGRYNVARLIAAQGADAKLTDLLVTLANCKRARSFSVYDRCKAKFEGFSFRA